MVDIGVELLKKIQTDFSAHTVKLLERKNYDFVDVAYLSDRLGTELSRSIAKYVIPENLPNDTLYYNIANTILTNTLHNNYDIINNVAAEVQNILDEKIGLKIEPQKAPFPSERVNSVVNAAASDVAGNINTRRIDSPIRNITNSFLDNYVETNAKFRNDAGVQCYIVRDGSHCCKWCAKLTGKYKYPDNVPHDIYRRHDNCTCTVTYESGRQRQNVWSKKSWQATDKELAKRQEISNNAKPTVLSHLAANEKEKDRLNHINVLNKT